MDIRVFKELYLVQTSSSFDAGISLVQKKAEQLSLLSSHPQVAMLQKSWYKEGLYFFGYAEYPCPLNSLWSTFEELVLAWFVPGLTLATCTHCTMGFPQKLLSRVGLNCLGLGRTQGCPRAQWCQSNSPNSILVPTINLVHKMALKCLYFLKLNYYFIFQVSRPFSFIIVN